MNVLIKAYVNGNLGDDLMIRVLCNRYPQTIFTLCGKEEYASSFADCENLHYIRNDTFAKKIVTRLLSIILHNRNLSYAELLLLTKHYDEHIILGGSMFIEGRDRGKVKTDAMWLKRKPYIIGFNFGPFKTDSFYDFYNNYFSKCPGLCTRDQATKRLFEHSSNIIYAPDIVFSKEEKPTRNKTNEALISVISKRSLPISEELYIRIVCNIIKQTREAGLIPILTSFCRSEGDESMIDSIQKRLVINCSELKYNGKNAIEVEKRIAHADCIFAGRFHAMVLAFLHQTKCIPIIYSPKMSNVIADAKYSGCFIDLMDETTYTNDKIHEAIHCSNNAFSSDYINMAKKQFAFLDKVLR